MGEEQAPNPWRYSLFRSVDPFPPIGAPLSDPHDGPNKTPA